MRMAGTHIVFHGLIEETARYISHCEGIVAELIVHSEHGSWARRAKWEGKGKGSSPP